MATTDENATERDPLGLKRFALTESAYDLVNTIRGTYGRLSHAENQKDNPDQELINSWHNRSKEVGRAYRRLSGESLSSIEEFISVSTTEWNQITKLEQERTPLPVHVS